MLPASAGFLSPAEVYVADLSIGFKKKTEKDV